MFRRGGGARCRAERSAAGGRLYAASAGRGISLGGEREGANCFLCRAGESAPRLGCLPLGWGGDSPRLVERVRGLSRGLLASGSAGRAGGETRGERVTGLGQVRALGILALFGEGSRVRVAERAKVVMSRSGR